MLSFSVLYGVYTLFFINTYILVCIFYLSVSRISWINKITSVLYSIITVIKTESVDNDLENSPDKPLSSELSTSLGWFSRQSYLHLIWLLLLISQKPLICSVWAHTYMWQLYEHILCWWCFWGLVTVAAEWMLVLQMWYWWDNDKLYNFFYFF